MVRRKLKLSGREVDHLGKWGRKSEGGKFELGEDLGREEVDGGRRVWSLWWMEGRMLSLRRREEGKGER